MFSANAYFFRLGELGHILGSTLLDVERLRIISFVSLIRSDKMLVDRGKSGCSTPPSRGRDLLANGRLDRFSSSAN
jgi:hypothetical protein